MKILFGPIEDVIEFILEKEFELASVHKTVNDIMNEEL